MQEPGGATGVLIIFGPWPTPLKPRSAIIMTGINKSIRPFKPKTNSVGNGDSSNAPKDNTQVGFRLDLLLKKKKLY
jgi:hypothetical protein